MEMALVEKLGRMRVTRPGGTAGELVLPSLDTILGGVVRWCCGEVMRELLGLQASLSTPSCSDNMLCDFSNQTNLKWVSDKSDENPSKFDTVLDG